MDNEIKMMLNAILEEMDKMGGGINQRFDKIDFQFEVMQHGLRNWKKG